MVSWQHKFIFFVDKLCMYTKYSVLFTNTSKRLENDQRGNV